MHVFRRFEKWLEAEKYADTGEDDSVLEGSRTRWIENAITMEGAGSRWIHNKVCWRLQEVMYRRGQQSAGFWESLG